MVFVAAALLGFGLSGWRASVFTESRLSPALEGRDIEVIGQVLAMPQAGEEGLRFRLGIESASLGGQSVTLPPQILLGWYAGFGAREPKNASAESSDVSELALESQRQPQALQAGERWQMTVRLKAPHGNSNPHGFDYELWLWEQGIQATGYVRAGPATRRRGGSGQTWRIRWSAPGSRCARRFYARGHDPASAPACWPRWSWATRTPSSAPTGMSSARPAWRI